MVLTRFLVLGQCLLQFISIVHSFSSYHSKFPSSRQRISPDTRRITTFRRFASWFSNDISKHESAVVSRTETAIQSSITRPVALRSPSRQWGQLTPNLWQRGVDVRLTWVPSKTSSEEVAFKLLEMTEEQGGNISEKLELEKDLTSWINSFTKYCTNSLVPSHWDALTLRIVSSRGPLSTKCPRWHLDQVPFRWIHSLVGPGCQWVDPISSEVLLNSLLSKTQDEEVFEDESAEQANTRRVNPITTQIKQANPGEAVVLVGKGWKDDATEKTELAPVIHKSPDGIKPWQGRVLLTMDIVQFEER